MKIVVEMKRYVYLLRQILSYLLVLLDDIVKCIYWYVVASHQIEVLAEGESSKVVAFNDSAEFGVFFLQSHDA